MRARAAAGRRRATLAELVDGPRRGRRRPGGSRERGQASLEMAALAPVVLVLVLAALQVIVLAYTAHAASQAAREGARAYSLDESPSAAASASLPGAVRLVGVQTSGPDHTVRVTVAAPFAVYPFDPEISRSVSMP